MAGQNVVLNGWCQLYNLVNPNYFSVGQSLRNISSLAGTDKTVGRTVSWLDNLTSIVILIPH